MKSIESVDIKGKKILLRVDLNSPVEYGKVISNPRLVLHSKTIKQLSEKGAKVIIIAHQGRKGNHDFTSLSQHAKLVEQLTGVPIKFVDDVIGVKVTQAIEQMQNHDVLMLDNVRFLIDEMSDHPSDSLLVRSLAPLVDCFVLDALSVAHRAQSSVVGFSKHISCYAGPVLMHEVNALNKVMEDGPVTFIFGGAKPKDSFEILKYWLGKEHVNKVLVGGAVAMLFLYAKGVNIGTSLPFLEKQGGLEVLDEARRELEKYPDKIVLPLDVALRLEGKRVEVSVDNIYEGGIWDIGEKTINLYSEIVKQSPVIVVNGPLGVYEINEFAKGTREIFTTLQNYDNYTVCGGGHTATAVEMFNINVSKLGDVSLAGKAFIEFLSGKELPGLKALKESRS